MDAHIPGIASIWITKGNYAADKIYQEYEDTTNAPLLVYWNGQNSGRQDHLVVGCQHITHVFYRARPGAFTYLGIVDNQTITGPHGFYDHDEGIPATYYFNVSTRPGVGVARGTVCVPDEATVSVPYKWKRAAADAVGLAGGNMGSGIVEHRKPVGKSGEFGASLSEVNYDDLLGEIAAMEAAPVAAPAALMPGRMRDMRKCIRDGQRVRHIHTNEVWTATYNKELNRLVHAGVEYKSPSGFAKAHQRSNPNRWFGNANGWTECELETAPGVWVKMTNLPEIVLA